MKKVLIGSTALLAAGLIAGPVLAGEPLTASRVDLTLGGDIDMTIHYQSNQPTKSDTDIERNHAFDLDGELHFMGEAVTDAGLEFGFEIELEAAGAGVGGTTPDPIDQNWIWVDGRFGKVTMGGTDAVELDGNGDTETYSGVGKLTADTNSNEASSFSDTIDCCGEMNKFIWEPPAMGGLQLAINYVPDTEDQNTTGTTDADDVGDEEKDMMIALQYEATVGEAEFGIDVAYATADAEDRAVDVRIGKNIRWRVGGQVEVAGFQLGGFWKSFTEYAADTTQTEDRVNIGFNAEYETGPWTTGVSYRRATADEMSAGTATVKGTKTGEDKATQWNIGVTYELNDDMTLKAGYETQKWEDDANLATDENDAKSLDLKFEWDVWDGLEFDVGYQNFRYTHHDGLATSAKRSGHALTVFTEVTF